MHLVVFGHHPYASYYIEAQTISPFYNTSGIAATRERERERERKRERERENEREKERTGSYASGKLLVFQGQGIMEFYVV